MRRDLAGLCIPAGKGLYQPRPPRSGRAIPHRPHRLTLLLILLVALIATLTGCASTETGVTPLAPEPEQGVNATKTWQRKRISPSR